MSDSSDPRYPIGIGPNVQSLSPDQRSAAIAALSALPAEFRAALSGLTGSQLDTPYRAGGWTLRQLAHHLPDSHMNAYIRMKLALTEQHPVIKLYDEAAWAELPDSRDDVAPSLDLLTALHARWIMLLEGLTPEQWHRSFHHPVNGKDSSLDATLAFYAWHGRHHTAHALRLRELNGW